MHTRHLARPFLSMILCAAWVGVALCGCTAGPDAGTSASLGAAPSAATTTPQTTGPMNERDARRAREWAEAVAGLDFTGERVTVTAPPAASDVAAAERFMAEGRSLMMSNHRTETVKAFASAVRAAPDHAPAHAMLGLAMRGRGKTDLAIAAYRTAIELDPADLDSRYELAMELSSAQRGDEAVTVMEDLLALDPAQGRAHERLAIWRYYGGDDARAWEHVRAARALGTPLPPQFLSLLAQRTPEPR